MYTQNCMTVVPAPFDFAQDERMAEIGTYRLLPQAAGAAGLAPPESIGREEITLLQAVDKQGFIVAVKRTD